MNLQSRISVNKKPLVDMLYYGSYTFINFDVSYMTAEPLKYSSINYSL